VINTIWMGQGAKRRELGQKIEAGGARLFLKQESYREGECEGECEVAVAT